MSASRYEIVGKLGAGGMGEVFRARDGMLERWVALKRLPPDIADDTARHRRFLREARAASALNHPGIVTIHDLVRLEDVDYIVMELIEGRPLNECIPRGGLRTPEALDWALQIARALAAAHEAGIVHRDLKPGNVMIAEDDRVKVLDFGLAKRSATVEAETEAPTLSAPLTRRGAVLGTLDYMSPEQALGKPADARSDVFSFGTLLYEMLTGERPFRGENAAGVLHAVVYHQPVPVETLRSDIPPPVAALVRKALEKKPSQRYESMSVVAPVLETLSLARDSVPGESMLDSLPASDVMSKQALAEGRSWTGYKVTAAVVVVLGLLTATPAVQELVRSWILPRPEAASAVDPDPLAALEPYELYQQGVHLLERWERKENILEAIRRFRLAVRKNDRFAPAYAALGRALWRRYRVDKDPTWLQQGLSNSEYAFELDPQLTAARVSRGLLRSELGHRDAARADFEEVLKLDPANADALRGLAQLAQRDGAMDRAEEFYRNALAARPDDWELVALLGYIQYSTGRYAEAEASFRASVELTPDNHSPRQSLAAALHMQGRYAEAATELQKALAIRPEADVYTNLGTLYFFQGLYEQAAGAFEKSVELGPNSYLRWANLGDAYRMLPATAEKAGEAYQRAIQLLAEKLEAAPEDAVLRSRYALYLARLGNAGEAMAELERDSGQGKLDAGSSFRRALAFEVLGARDRALSSLEDALGAGYSLTEIRNEPDLSDLRNDVGYHRMIMRYEQAQRPKG